MRFQLAAGTRRALDGVNIECNKILPDSFTESKPKAVVAPGRFS